MPVQVAILATCVVDLFEPSVGRSTVALLEAAGCTVSFPPAQTCCGQPAWNAGFAPEAARVARGTLDALHDDPSEAVVVPSGSCAAQVRHRWPELFRIVGDPETAARADAVAARTWELSELLTTRTLPPLRLERPLRVAYHHSCHLLRDLRVREAPLELLARVDGVELVTWPEAETCCGFGGTFSVKLPEVAVAMADTKLDALGTGPDRPDVVVSADTSCLVHLRGRAQRRDLGVRFAHLAEVLAAALPSPGPTGGTPQARAARTGP